eukprot:CAMPEP_0202509328 /NCGR_PEP_ID=MMETSP1361-20130828/52715_1 /ASSEMBLY_ACC=CAM_ASM_000849 /TAXON_ID=210615 /ORGANISM="Staurosira complex sp., Strain CCMP2646" /LENGTH=489 /DNA_ID=CAMNT_0049143545 /DNA_START=44 /DNA_END=1513 /DNA_ORIENTATION=-
MSVTSSADKKKDTSTSLQVMEHQAQQSYSLPGHYEPRVNSSIQQREVEWVRNTDGTLLIDHRGNPITVDRMLATKPLRGELSTRPGPGNRKLTYLSGEGVTRTLNDIFGFDGWNLDIKRTQREECVKDDNGRYHVAYTATVRLTHRKSGAYKEDCGAGDSIDKSMGTAVAHALKASITDAMKRAARHFGDKLGNSLYQGNFSIKSAPNSLKEALDQYDIQRAKTKFGFLKDRAATSDADLAASVGLTIDNTCSIPASAGHQEHTASNMVPPKAPVPPFNNNTAAVTKAINPLVSQTPQGVRSALVSQQTPSAYILVNADKRQQQQAPPPPPPPFASRQSQQQHQQQPPVDASLGQSAQPVQAPGVSQQQQQPPPPFASRQKPQQQPPFTSSQGGKPPPTSTQGLQSSALFKLPAFAAGNNATEATMRDENVPPERPTTSSGNKPPSIGALIATNNAQGTKRSLDPAAASSQSQTIRNKAPNANPYRASL